MTCGQAALSCIGWTRPWCYYAVSTVLSLQLPSNALYDQRLCAASSCPVLAAEWFFLRLRASAFYFHQAPHPKGVLLDLSGMVSTRHAPVVACVTTHTAVVVDETNKVMFYYLQCLL